jgi:hypothetical protein
MIIIILKYNKKDYNKIKFFKALKKKKKIIKKYFILIKNSLNKLLIKQKIIN